MKSVELLEEKGLELNLLANTKQKIEMSLQDEKKTYVQDVINYRHLKVTGGESFTPKDFLQILDLLLKKIQQKILH